VYISRVNEGGPAALDGKLAAGDRIVSVSLFHLVHSSQMLHSLQYYSNYINSNNGNLVFINEVALR